MCRRDIFAPAYGLRPQHIPPAVSVIEAEPCRILTAKREDGCPHISLMPIQFFGYFREVDADSVIGKQTVRAEALRPRPCSNIVRIGFSFHHLLCVVFQRTSNKLGGVCHRHGTAVVIVLMHIFCIGKIPENFSDQVLLFFGGGKMFLAVIDLIHAFTGSNIFHITSGFFTRFDEFEFRNELRHMLSFVLQMSNAYFKLLAMPFDKHKKARRKLNRLA